MGPHADWTTFWNEQKGPAQAVGPAPVATSAPASTPAPVATTWEEFHRADSPGNPAQELKKPGWRAVPDGPVAPSPAPRAQGWKSRR